MKATKTKRPKQTKNSGSFKVGYKGTPPTAPGKFAPGNQAAVGHGRPSVPEDIKQLRKLNRPEVERLLNKFIEWKLDDLVAYLDGSHPILEMACAKFIYLAYRSGDTTRLKFLFDNLIGPLPTNHNLNFGGNINAQVAAIINDLEAEEKDVTPGEGE